MFQSSFKLPCPAPPAAPASAQASGNRLTTLPPSCTALTRLVLLDVSWQYNREPHAFQLPQGVSALSALRALGAGSLGRDALSSPALGALQVGAPRESEGGVRGRGE